MSLKRFVYDWERSRASFREITDVEKGYVAWSKTVTHEDGTRTALVLLTPDGRLPPEDLPEPKVTVYGQLLQSNIQKHVRGFWTGLGGLHSIVATVWQLFLQGDAVLILRRLPIIAVEDSAPPEEGEATAAVVWMAIAASYSCPAAQTQAVASLAAGYAVALAAGDVTAFPPAEKKREEEGPVDPLVQESLRTRIYFGGMKGDMRMLETVLAAGCVTSKVMVTPQPLRAFSMDDALHQAADFHCTSILDDLAGVFPGTRAHHKDLIWTYSSGPNRRRAWIHLEGRKHLWPEIKTAVTCLQKAIWKRCTHPYRREKRVQTRISSFMSKK